MDVALQWKITRDRENYVYAYVVSNGPSARQPIHRWSIETANSTNTRATHNSWAGRIANSSPGISSGLDVAERPQAIKFQGRVEFTNPKGPDILSGQAASGFVITSDLAPGFVLAHGKGGSLQRDVTPQDIASLPPQVGDELNKCLSEQWDSKAIQVIGPAIPKGVSVFEVEQNYLLGVQHILGHGSHRRQSPALEQLIAILKNASSSEGSRVSLQDIESLENWALRTNFRF